MKNGKRQESVEEKDKPSQRDPDHHRGAHTDHRSVVRALVVHQHLGMLTDPGSQPKAPETALV